MVLLFDVTEMYCIQIVIFQTPYEVFEELTEVNVRKIMGYAIIT